MTCTIIVISAFYLFIGGIISFFLDGGRDYNLLGFNIESRLQNALADSKAKEEVKATFNVYESALNERLSKTTQMLLQRFFGIDLAKIIKHFALAQIMLNKRAKRPLKAKYTIALVLFALSFIPIPLGQEQGYNTFEIIYAFFDMPSVFCVFLCGLFIMRSIFGDMFRFSFVGAFVESTMRCKDSTILILCLFGVVLYLGVLNLLPFDMYHLGIWQSGLITLGVIVLISFLDLVALLLLLLTLCIFVFYRVDISLGEFIICPYLWLYGIIFTCIYGTQRIFYATVLKHFLLLKS